MKEKDYHSIHEKYFNEYIDEYINEMEGIYKSSLEEGDAEDIAHECCITILKEKVIDLKIKNQPHSKLYSIFTRRTKLVQDTNPNRLYTKYIIPACEELRNELNEDIIEDYIKEFATLEVHYLLLGRYVQWSVLYKMMFDLKDFTEFKIIKNANFPAGSEILKKYNSEYDPKSNVVEEKVVKDSKQKDYKELYPESDVNKANGLDNNDKDNWKDKKNFRLKEEYESKIIQVFDYCIANAIIDTEISFESFNKVLREDWNKHNCKIKFHSTQFIALLVQKMGFAFENFNDKSVSNSKLFLSERGNFITSQNLRSSRKCFKDKNHLSHSEIPKYLNDKQIKYLNNVDEIIEILKK